MMFIKQLLSRLLSSQELPENAILIDVRSKLEYAQESIKGSIIIPVKEIEESIGYLNTLDKQEPIIVYCAAGGRAVKAKKKLEAMGFEQVFNGGSFQNVAKKLDKEIQYSTLNE